MVRERMSRPSSSVPNQCAREAEFRREGRSIAAGSWRSDPGREDRTDYEHDDENNAGRGQRIVARISGNSAAK